MEVRIGLEWIVESGFELHNTLIKRMEIPTMGLILIHNQSMNHCLEWTWRTQIKYSRSVFSSTFFICIFPCFPCVSIGVAGSSSSSSLSNSLLKKIRWSSQEFCISLQSLILPTAIPSEYWSISTDQYHYLLCVFMLYVLRPYIILYCVNGAFIGRMNWLEFYRSNCLILAGFVSINWYSMYGSSQLYLIEFDYY